MRRSLFAREFRSALVPNLVTGGAILATFVVMERLYGLRLGVAEDVRFFTDVALLIGLVVSGFISGERCFPAELKESRILFLSSLPISRSWVWLVIVSARLLAAVASLVLTVALRRPRLPFPEIILSWQDIGLFAAYILLAYILFFSAGTLFALLFRRTLFSYVAGILILGLLLNETFIAIRYSLTARDARFPLFLIPFFDPDRTSAFLSFLLVLSFLLSWRFFVQGEIANPKRRISNQLLFGIIATAYLGLVFYVQSNPKLKSSPKPESTPESIDNTSAEVNPLLFDLEQATPSRVSPDGRYLFVLESLDRRPMIRVSIVDTHTGRVTGQLVSAGIGWGYWSDHGDVLNLLVLRHSPFERWGYVAPGTVDWFRLSPKAQALSKFRLINVAAVKILSGGRALAVLREGNQGRILLLESTSRRRYSQLIRAPLDGNVVAQADGSAALVYFDNVLLPRRAWVVDSLAREVLIPRSIPQTSYVLFGEVFGSPAEAQAALLRKFASPQVPGGPLTRGSFVLPSQTWIFTGPKAKGVYFWEERDPDTKVLWARSADPGGRWEKLPEIAPSLLPLLELPTNLKGFIDPASGTSAFLSGGSGVGKFFVYDPELGTFLEAESCTEGRKALLKVERVPGLRGILIKLTCMEKAPSVKAQTHYFEHLPGSREVRAIKTVATPSFYAPQPLYLDEHGWEVSRTLDQKGREEIWRSSPGTSDLRLWPQGGAKDSGDGGGRPVLQGFSF